MFKASDLNSTIEFQKQIDRELLPSSGAAFPEYVNRYPRLRFMGSKYRLLPWIFEVVKDLKFGSVLDAFSGSGSVAYLLKSMGKRVTTNDSLRFTSTISRAVIENSGTKVERNL